MRKRNRYKTSRRRMLKIGPLFTWSGLKAALLRLCLPVLFALGVAGFFGLSAALAHTYYALERAPWPRLDALDITGLKRMDRKDLLNAIKVPKGANILTLRIDSIAKRVEALPWVKSSVVRLELPSRLVVDVVEREAIAVVYTDSFHLMDRDGELFMEVQPEQYAGLLLVTGINADSLENGNKLPDEPLETLRDLLAALDKEQSWMPISHISQCNWQRGVGFTLYMTHKAIPIQIGKDDFSGKLHRLQKVIGELANREWWDLVTRIDLDYKNRAYVKGNFAFPKGI